MSSLLDKLDKSLGKSNRELSLPSISPIELNVTFYDKKTTYVAWN